MTGVEWVNARLFATSDVTDFVGDRIFAQKEVGEQTPWVAFHLSGVDDLYDLDGHCFGWEEVRVEYGSEDWEQMVALGKAIRAALSVKPHFRIAGGDIPSGGDNENPNNPQLFRAWQEFKVWIPGTEE
jgi:hypothetical protein